jgi:hypothetical protein
MKRICILSAVNIRHMTLISLYTERLKRDNIAYDIIYMDKYGEEEEFNANNKFVFTNIINHKDKKIKKVLQYFKFKKFAIPILENNKYDFIIVWNDVAIFMFANYLSKKWEKKYCLNIRDYSGERNPYIYYRFKKVIKNAAFTTISSDGFRKFLPPHDYLQVHSFNESILTNIKSKESFREGPIRIVFIGNVRFLDINRHLLDIFKNDKRFELHYYGTNAEILECYAKENNIQNTKFFGTFQVSETSKYIAITDIVNNLYGNESISLIYALSIKLYYGIYNRTPILVFKGTYMAEIVSKYDIGFVVDKIDNSLPDQLYKWYKNQDFNKFNQNCERALIDIKENHGKFENAYEKYIL